MKQDSNVAHKMTIYHVKDKNIVDLLDAASEYMVENIASGVDPKLWFLFLESREHEYVEVRGKDMADVVGKAMAIPHRRAVCVSPTESMWGYVLVVWRGFISASPLSYTVGHANIGPNGEVVYSRFTSNPELVGYAPGEGWTQDPKTGWWVRIVEI